MSEEATEEIRARNPEEFDAAVAGAYGELVREYNENSVHREMREHLGLNAPPLRDEEKLLDPKTLVAIAASIAPEEAGNDPVKALNRAARLWLHAVDLAESSRTMSREELWKEIDPAKVKRGQETLARLHVAMAAEYGPRLLALGDNSSSPLRDYVNDRLKKLDSPNQFGTLGRLLKELRLSPENGSIERAYADRAVDDYEHFRKAKERNRKSRDRLAEREKKLRKRCEDEGIPWPPTVDVK